MNRPVNLVRENRPLVDKLVEVLLEQETLTAEQIQNIVEGKPFNTPVYRTASCLTIPPLHAGALFPKETLWIPLFEPSLKTVPSASWPLIPPKRFKKP
jgi:hypothetical protein